jgi:hypothetical protein
MWSQPIRIVITVEVDQECPGGPSVRVDTDSGSDRGTLVPDRVRLDAALPSPRHPSTSSGPKPTWRRAPQPRPGPTGRIERHEEAVMTAVENVSLVRERSQAAVYLVVGDVRFLVADTVEFAALGLRWERVSVVDDGSLRSSVVEAGEPVVITPGWVLFGDGL